MNEELEEEVKKITDKVEGFLSEREGEFLYKQAKNCSWEGVIVEIGSWKGKSTIWLGKGSKSGKNVKIYAIDPHTGSSEHKKIYGKVWTFEEFKDNIKNAEVDDVVVPIVKTSEEASKDFKEPIEFIFIDGAHEYEFVKSDFENWFPILIDGGIMAFHDATVAPSVKKVVEEFIFKSKNFKNVGIVDSIVFGQKCKKNSLIDKSRNVCVLLFMRISIFAAHLPKSIRKIGKRLLGRM